VATSYDIIGFDLDGTLNPSKLPLEPDMAALLARILAIYKVAVISGGSYEQFQRQFLGHFPCPTELLPNLFLLPTDGAMLCATENGDWKCTHENIFTDEEKKKIRQAFENALPNAGYSTPEKVYGEILEDRSTQMTFSAFGMEAPLAVKETWDPDHAKRKKIIAALEPLLPEFSVHMGGTTSIDITRAGIDKAYGLKRVLAQLHIPPEKMLYFGDALYEGGNDAPAKTIGATCVQVSGPAETRTHLLRLLAS
jgi:phosphomannomutase